MKMAMLILECGDTNIITYTLSEKVGFNDTDYFERCFRKYAGMSFSQYKKQKRQGKKGRMRAGNSKV